jgi:hypothetical protein
MREHNGIAAGRTQKDVTLVDVTVKDARYARAARPELLREDGLHAAVRVRDLNRCLKPVLAHASSCRARRGSFRSSHYEENQYFATRVK